jgi:hypothetical protein
MLILVVLTMGLLIALCMMAFSFNGFLYRNGQAQYGIDALSMSLASSINEGDRVGQINELVAASRELVYTSRSQFEQCTEQEERTMESLCNQLLDEARTGQQLVEAERKNQAQIIVADLQNAAARHNQSAHGTFNLAWLSTEEPVIERIDIGSIQGVESSVQTTPVINKLYEYDKQTGLVNAKNYLYRANVNAKLPAGDTDLDFKLSSLPAYIDDTSAPARNTNADVFMPAICIFNHGQKLPCKIDQIPGAVQVTCSMATALGQNDFHKASVGITSTAVATGAMVGAK